MPSSALPNSRTFPSHQNKTWYLLAATPYFPLPPSLATTNLLFIFIDLLILVVSYKWDRIIGDLLCLGFFQGSFMLQHVSVLYSFLLLHNILLYRYYILFIHSSVDSHFYIYMKYIYMCIYFFILGLHWVFVAACGLSLVAMSGGYSSLQRVGFSLQWLLLLQSTGSIDTGFSSCSTRAQQLWCASSRVRGLQQLWRAGSVVVHGLSCSAACGISPDQGSNPCSLHWQVDS